MDFNYNIVIGIHLKTSLALQLLTFTLLRWWEVVQFYDFVGSKNDWAL